CSRPPSDQGTVGRHASGRAHAEQGFALAMVRAGARFEVSSSFGRRAVRRFGHFRRGAARRGATLTSEATMDSKTLQHALQEVHFQLAHAHATIATAHASWIAPPEPDKQGLHEAIASARDAARRIDEALANLQSKL